MFTLKLIKGLSYAGAVYATKESPEVSVEDKATAEALIASGYFKLVDSAENDGAGSNTAADIDKMTVAQLEAYAADKGIDLAGCNKKAAILAKIKEANDAENDGEADYGEDD